MPPSAAAVLQHASMGGECNNASKHQALIQVTARELDQLPDPLLTRMP